MLDAALDAATNPANGDDAGARPDDGGEAGHAPVDAATAGHIADAAPSAGEGGSAAGAGGSTAAGSAAGEGGPAAGAGGVIALAGTGGTAGASGTSGSAGAPELTPPEANGGIETVMLDAVLVPNAGGSFDEDYRPVVLYRDGSACRNMNVVVAGTDLAAHRAMNPASWTEWKVVDDKVALLENGNWSKLAFQLKFAPNSDLTFDGKVFTRFTGATLPDVSVATKMFWRFTADHKVELSSDTGVWSSASPFGTTASVPPAQRATYRIDGYQITLSWEDGRVQQVAFAYNEKDPGAIYLNGLCFLTRS